MDTTDDGLLVATDKRRLTDTVGLLKATDTGRPTGTETSGLLMETDTGRPIGTESGLLMGTDTGRPTGTETGGLLMATDTGRLTGTGLLRATDNGKALLPAICAITAGGMILTDGEEANGTAVMGDVTPCFACAEILI